MKVWALKILKILLIIFGSVTIFVALVILLISPIAKYLIEKYDEKYTGRQITLDWIYVNPFTGYVHIRNLKIYETGNQPAYKEGDSLFFSAHELSATFVMPKLLNKIIEIHKLSIDQPLGTIIQYDNGFNFSDIIKKFSSDSTDTTPSKFRFNILGISINNGVLYYHEKATPVNYFIKGINAESSGKPYLSDTVTTKFNFLSGSAGGTVKGNLTINLRNKDFRLAALFNKFELKPLEQYLKDLINYGSFKANLDANIIATGNFRDPENLYAKGQLAINDFHFGKNPDEDYASFDKFEFFINKLSPNNHIYIFDSISLNHPFFKYENYDNLDNLETMFGKKGSNISSVSEAPGRINVILKIAHYIKAVARNFLQSDYKINKLVIREGGFKFVDYSQSEKFTVEASPLYILADSVNKNHKRLEISMKSGIIPYGRTSVNISINPNDSSEFDLKYNIEKLPLSIFNPYLIASTSFPVDRGTLELKGNWKVRNGFLKSDNHLVLIDPRISTRQNNLFTKWIPMPLLTFFLRDRGNVFDYDIPITGNLKNPRFHLHQAFWGILGNIFSTPVNIPYKIRVTSIENDIEKFSTVEWIMQQTSLQRSQKRFVAKMAKFLVKNPDASITVYPMMYVDKEKEYILFYETKKKYFLKSQNSKDKYFNKDDSLKVDRMSIKDPLFIKYLDNQANNKLLFTAQEKCRNLIGPAIINARFMKVMKIREIEFLAGFRDKSVEKRVRIRPFESTIPYNGFSFYKIVYNGRVPVLLAKAKLKISKLNKESPREDYKKLRIK